MRHRVLVRVFAAFALIAAAPVVSADALYRGSVKLGGAKDVARALGASLATDAALIRLAVRLGVAWPEEVAAIAAAETPEWAARAVTAAVLADPEQCDRTLATALAARVDPTDPEAASLTLELAEAAFRGLWTAMLPEATARREALECLAAALSLSPPDLTDALAALAAEASPTSEDDGAMLLAALGPGAETGEAIRRRPGFARARPTLEIIIPSTPAQDAPSRN